MAGQVSPWGGWSSFVQGLCAQLQARKHLYLGKLVGGSVFNEQGMEVAGNSFAIMVYLSRKKFGGAKTLSHMVQLCG